MIWITKLIPCILFVLLQSALLGSGIKVPGPAYLIWSNGPPNLKPDADKGGSYVSADTDQRFLLIQTGQFRFELDVRDLRITQFRETESNKTAHPLETEQPPAAGNGRLSWKTAGGTITVGGDQGVEYEPEFFPVRIVETGPWFQHFTVHDLQWEGNVPKSLPGDFWLEVMAWSDRMSILLRTTNPDLAEAFPKLASWEGIRGMGLNFVSSPPTLPEQEMEGQPVYTFVALDWELDTRVPGGSVESKDPALRVVHDLFEDADHLVLDPLAFPSNARTALGTPVRIGQSRDYEFQLRNPSSIDVRLDLAVQLPENTSMTGHNLMLIDSRGNQTGIPIQISKNWHRKELDKFLPYMGYWSHGRVSLILPAGFDETCTLRLVQGDYGSYNASSISQLSLVGWGGNGIWIQAALGSWGETICLQPGRVLRRTMVTDWRSFKTHSMQGKEYGWTANAGGADIFVYFDASGNYVPFIENQHLLTSYGPCLAQMNFSEISKDRKIAVQGTWYLPQTNDFARTYLKVRCEVLEDVEYSRFSFIQLGADRYNANMSSIGAVGDSDGLGYQIHFDDSADKDGYISDAITMTGRTPWITLAGDAIEPSSRLGQAQRILMVHEWRARIGGELATTPAAAFYKHQFHRKDNFSAEIIPGKGIQQLRKGDFIEMTLELTLTPLTRDSYYGGSQLVEELIERHVNNWKAAHAVAKVSNPVLTIGNKRKIKGPLPQIDFTDITQVLTLHGTVALVPLSVKNVPESGSFSLKDENNQEVIALTQEWRKLETGNWTVVVMLDPQKLPGRFQIRLNP